MASEVVNELYCIQHCLVVCEQNRILNSVRVENWTTE